MSRGRNVFLASISMMAAFFGSVVSFAQQLPAGVAGPQASTDFPLVLRQSVAAGKTAVGTKIEGKLVVATLVNGVVIPRDAVFSGEVTESAAKTKDDPSRLAIRLDSAQWKNGSTPVKAYLTTWFYPVEELSSQDLSYRPAAANTNSPRTWNGAGAYPDPNNPVAQDRFPQPADNRDKDVSPSPASGIAKHRTLMKNVDSARAIGGGVVLISTHSNIKLDKVTTYVFGGEDMIPSPKK